MKKYPFYLALVFSSILICSAYILSASEAFSYGSSIPCYETYGYMSVDNFDGTCGCMSGYVFGNDILGNKQCISGNTICTDKYGYHSSYDSYSKSCECNSGYVFGKNSIGQTECISPDSICSDKLGYNSRYNSLSDTCECRSGYVIDGGRCVSGTTACFSDHGIYATYDYISNSCKCLTGYTFDDNNQCVKKQNNVYFTLKELDTANRQAVVKSDYDFRYYLITYNSGCYETSFRRYINSKIVINLGTDFSLDSWDKIVLFDDNETCDVTHVSRADITTTLVPEFEEEIFTPITPYNYKVTPVIPKVTKPQPVDKIEAPIKQEESTTTLITDIKYSDSTSSEIKIEVKKNIFIRFYNWIFRRN